MPRAPGLILAKTVWVHLGDVHFCPLDIGHCTLDSFRGVGLAGSVCRVNGVKMARLAITQEWQGRLSPNLVCG